MTKKGQLKVVHDDDFYQAMRRSIREWAEEKGKGHEYLEYVLVAPDMLHLMSKLTLDSRVPLKQKIKLGFAVAYFISPIDLLPEAVLGPIGYLDDIAVAAWVLDDLIKTAGRDLVLEHWAGDVDIIETVARITGAANDILGSGLVRRLKRAVDKQGFEPDMLEGAKPRKELPEPEDE
jgi:uncharacterized membrane protein YkvA (DUF1232 family)